MEAVSLFCGAGGLDMGLERAGIKTIWANDINSDACQTHRLWSEAEVIEQNARDLNFDQIPDTDIITGGFPCQGFSLAGPRQIDDSRNQMYLYFIKALQVKKPPVFLAENVKGILTLGGGLVLEKILKDFASVGYTVYWKLLNAADYGVPQDRHRVFFVGFRDHVPFSFPERQSRVAMKDILPREQLGEVCKAPFSSRYMSRNRRRDWDEVSYTIPASAKQVPLHPSSPPMIKIGKDQWQFGGDSRRFSWREAALVQSFPDMEFTGSLESKYAQIGNAVPPKLAEAVGKSILRAIKEEPTCTMLS